MQREILFAIAFALIFCSQRNYRKSHWWNFPITWSDVWKQAFNGLRKCFSRTPTLLRHWFSCDWSIMWLVCQAEWWWWGQPCGPFPWLCFNLFPPFPCRMLILALTRVNVVGDVNASRSQGRSNKMSRSMCGITRRGHTTTSWDRATWWSCLSRSSNAILLTRSSGVDAVTSRKPFSLHHGLWLMPSLFFRKIQCLLFMVSGDQ